MGFGPHLRDTLKRAKLKRAYSVDQVKTPPVARFATQSERNVAYKVLKASGEFNPRKVGKYLIRFYILEQ